MFNGDWTIRSNSAWSKKKIQISSGSGCMADAERRLASILACKQSSLTVFDESYRSRVAQLTTLLANDVLFAVRLPVENEMVAQSSHFSDERT